jgi:hypothetical protein
MQEVNGLYEPRGLYGGITFFNKVGSPTDPLDNSIYAENLSWRIIYGGGITYYSTGAHADPWMVGVIEGQWNGIEGENGPEGLPVPVVTEVPMAPVVYRLKAPSTAPGGVFVSGGAADGIYVFTTADSYIKLGTEFSPHEIYWNGLNWVINSYGGSTVYYSNDNVGSPDLVQNWLDASDNNPVSISVISVTKGEMDAGLTVSGAGSGFVNGPMPKSANVESARYGYGSDRRIMHFGGFWNLVDDQLAATAYVAESESAFPWPGLGWLLVDGDAPAPAVSRNDIAAPANWEIV